MGANLTVPHDALTDPDVLATVLVLLEAIIGELHSKDALYLATTAAVAKAKRLGINEDKCRKVMERLVSFAVYKQLQHPLASMF